MKLNHYLPSEKLTFEEHTLRPNLLDWKPSKEQPGRYNNNLNLSPNFTSKPHRWFNVSLQLTNVCDLESVGAPGSIIMLPWGLKICERFAELVRKSALKSEYQEYSYPCLIPKSCLNSLSDLIDIEKSILHIAPSSDDTFGTNFALAPTGEYPIYRHWSLSIRSRNDLPKKLFQRTTYYRPISASKRSGSSVFVSMEANDVFEFHSCFSDSEASAIEASSLLCMFNHLARAIGTCALWTLRPPWTNRGNLYNWGFAGDALLPSLNTVQTATAYYQGDVFSKRFKTSFRKDSKICYVQQATGAITRRLIFANLFQTMRSDMSLCLHPNISPIHVTFFAISCTSDDELLISRIMTEFLHKNIIVNLIKIKSQHQLKKEEKIWYKLGIPIKLLFFGRTNHKDIRLVLTRNDTGEEFSEFSYDTVVKVTFNAIKDIKYYINISRRYLKNIIKCTHIGEVNEALTQHYVASFPLNVDPKCVQKIEDLKKGEVLGFYYSEEPSPCIVTDQMTNTKVFVSRRI